MRRLNRQLAARVEWAVQRLAETEQGDVTGPQVERPPSWRLESVTGGCAFASTVQAGDPSAARAAARTSLPWLMAR